MTSTAREAAIGARSEHPAGLTMCIECEDQEAAVECLNCAEPFCRPCFEQQHHRGKRASHRSAPILGEMLSQPAGNEIGASNTHMDGASLQIPENAKLKKQQREGAADNRRPASSSNGKVNGHHDTTAPVGNDIGANNARDRTASEDEEGEEENQGPVFAQVDEDTPRPGFMSSIYGRAMNAVGFVTSKLSSRAASTTNSDDDSDEDGNAPQNDQDGESNVQATNAKPNAHEDFAGRPLTRYQLIPMRLSEQERVYLTILLGCLQVSEYTDKIDTFRTWGNSGRILDELEEAFTYLSGLLICSDFKSGCQVVAKQHSENADFLQTCFEIGRRYKIMNPDKMRSTYGKLIYMLQDAVQVERTLRFSCKKPIVTVLSFLEERKCSELLSDPGLQAATAVLDGIKDRDDFQHRQKQKEIAVAQLCQKYSSALISEQEIERCISSITDSEVYRIQASAPVDRMLEYLTRFFNPTRSEGKYSLDISYGMGGSKLNHNHSTQYTFVLQTLTLWKELTSNMYILWRQTDEDMLSESNSYRLCNTGQGLNRVQSCPNVSRAMQTILRRVQAKCGSWVGLGVVHLGDRDVPNALMFIDKYTQVPRILAPIVQTLDSIPELNKDPAIARYFKAFGGPEELQKRILADYFKHGFDGDGDDGGSCIDGRLTSTWNWCSRIEKKSFYPVFLLAGFQGFDGNWKA